MLNKINEVPEGCMLDRKGRFVPLNQVPAHDLEMNDFVIRLVNQAKEQQELLREFKEQAFGDCYAFMDLLAEKYDRKVGGKKGNVSFTSYDGSYVVKIQVADSVHFGPELQIAKNIIDECLSDWAGNADEKLKAFIHDAFDVDKEGNLNTGRILSLRRIEIIDDRWSEAMKAIADSIMVSSTKPYVRFAQRNEDGKVVNIPLDLAAL